MRRRVARKIVTRAMRHAYSFPGHKSPWRWPTWHRAQRIWTRWYHRSKK